MKLENLTVVLPCHSLEDLALDRSSAEADQILAAWSAFYHPALVVRFRGPPGWRGSINAPSPPDGHLVALPPCCEEDLPDGWLKKSESAPAVVIREFTSRDEVIAKALETLEDPMPEGACADLVSDFLALGYCHLLVELLTRQLRYMSNLDEVAFESSTLSAAEKWAEGDTEAAREHLRSAFDLLTEAREYFYPVETYLLDFTLVAPSTIGPGLDDSLARGGPTNLAVSGATLEAIADQAPETLAKIRSGVEAGELSLIGGEFEELELPLLGAEATLEQFLRGRQAYERLLGRVPSIFCRRRFGLSPLLPQVLSRTGFAGACHFTLDDGRFPTNNQSRIKWEGSGGASVDALTRLPCDANRGGTFLALAETLGGAMDLDHAATAIFAHWPGTHSVWYEDLVRACGYSPVLGRFFSIDEYFKDTKYVGQATRYPAEKYKSPFLRQAVGRHDSAPVSRWQKAAQNDLRDQAEGALQAMAATISGCVPDESVRGDSQLQAIRRSIASQPDHAGSGCLVVNPLPFSRKILVDIADWQCLPAVSGLLVAAADHAGRKMAIVNVPGMGFAWIDPEMPPPESQPAPKKKRRLWPGKKKDEDPPPMAEENTLRNDFFELQVDPATGAVRSIHDYHTRDNRLAIQIAYRRPPEGGNRDGWDEDLEALYTIMAADAIELRSDGPLLGELAVRGRLIDRDGANVARYEQILRAQRGSRILEVELALEPERLPDGDPWTTYYAVRLAWGDATADLFAGIGSVTLPSEAQRLEAPYFVDIRSEKINTTLLTGGLPYHRRFGLRKMDTLLIVRGETQRRFRFGIGIDHSYPYAAAMEFLAPKTILSGAGPAPGPRSGWLFHLNARNVIATAWEPIVEGEQLRGMRVRLAETENRSVKLALQTIRPVAAARKVNFLGQHIDKLTVEDDRVTVPMKGHEWTQIELDFKS